jgi:hypothetical protein
MMRPLDDFLPEYEYSERHAIHIEAPPERIDAALRAVTLADSPVTHTLVRMRGLGRAADRPFLAGLERRGTVLEDAPGQGIVVRLAGDFWRRHGEQGNACQAVVDFRIDGPLLSTETRVHVPDAGDRRKFGRYWLVVRPFSGLTRRLILRAVKRRAEA